MTDRVAFVQIVSTAINLNKTCVIAPATLDDGSIALRIDTLDSRIYEVYISEKERDDAFEKLKAKVCAVLAPFWFIPLRDVLFNLEHIEAMSPAWAEGYPAIRVMIGGEQYHVIYPTSEYRDKALHQILCRITQ